MKRVDLHAYWDDKRMSIETMLACMHSAGIDRAVLSSPCTKDFEPDKSPFMYTVQRVLLRSDWLRPIAELISASFYDSRGRLRPWWRLFTRSGKPINKVIEPDNAGLLRVIEPHPQLSAWLWLNPHAMPAPDELKILVAHPRVAGIKLHAYWHRFPYEDARDIFSLAKDSGLSVYLILNFGWLESVATLLKEFPGVRVVFGYCGMPYFDALWREIKPFENAFVDFTSNHIDNNGIAAAVAALGPERCLYGSDCPYNFPDAAGVFDYSSNIQRVKASLPQEADERLVFELNAERLLR
ncbi:MAG: hypothetical protein COB53_04830 [Elusimicrobia bacterium]|nr:MAG: hypothetical protein COB53_04830 [Elusimicrobiota bacterium]